MEKFVLYSNGNEITLEVDFIERKGLKTIIKVNELKKKSNRLYYKEDAKLAFQGNKIILIFNDSNKLDITKNQKLIDKIYKEGNHTRFNRIYGYTSEFKNNYCD